MSPAFNISSQETGKQGTGDIMQAIRRHMSEIADEVGGEIAIERFRQKPYNYEKLAVHFQQSRHLHVR
mgnify:CR=1 FL=1